MSNALPLLVTLPVLVALLPPVLGRWIDNVGWPVALVGTAVQVGLATWVAWQVTTRGGLRLVVGGLPAVLGIELAVDRLSAVFVVLVAVAGLWGLIYTRRGGPRSAPGYSLYLVMLAGLSGICITRDVFNLYVFLEISGLSAYALVALGEGRDAAPAALKYLLIGTVGASAYLLGVAYLYIATGTLNMGALASQLAATGPHNRLVLAGFGLIVVGLGVKIALFPVHTWKPAAYRAAPAGITAVLAALVSTISAYALIRLLLSVFPRSLLVAQPRLLAVLQAAAVVSILSGAVLAFRAQDVRTMLAYSSISQFGIAVGGLGLGTALGVAGGSLHLLGHAVMKSGAFAVTGVLEAGESARTVDEYRNIAARRPIASAAFAVLTLGLIGIPPLVGFFGKWYVALSAVHSGAWILAAAVLASTGLSLTYFVRVLQRMYFEERSDHPTSVKVSRGMVAAGVIAALAALGLGLLSADIVDFLRPAIPEGWP